MSFFNNRNITYQIIISEVEKEETSGDRTLNSKEKFQLMVEQFPNIKILKDRIRLELDY